MNTWLLKDGGSAAFVKHRTESDIFKCLISNDVILRDYGRIMMGKPNPLEFGENTRSTRHTRLFWWLLRHRKYLCMVVSCEMVELFERAADYCTVTMHMLKSIGYYYREDCGELIYNVWLPRILPIVPNHHVANYYHWLLPRKWNPLSTEHTIFEKYAPYTINQMKTLRCKQVPYCYTLPGEFCVHNIDDMTIMRYAAAFGYGYIVARLLCYSTKRTYTLARSLIGLFGPDDMTCMFKHFCEISRCLNRAYMGVVMVNIFDDKCDMIKMLTKYNCAPHVFIHMMGPRTPIDIIKSHAKESILIYQSGKIPSWELSRLLYSYHIPKAIVREIVDEMGAGNTVDFLFV